MWCAQAHCFFFLTQFDSLTFYSIFIAYDIFQSRVSYLSYANRWKKKFFHQPIFYSYYNTKTFTLYIILANVISILRVMFFFPIGINIHARNSCLRLFSHSFYASPRPLPNYVSHPIACQIFFCRVQLS